MAEDVDEGTQTEEATPKRLEEAKSKGQAPTSREIATALLLFAAIGLFSFQGAVLWGSLQTKMRFLLGGRITSDFTPTSTAFLLRELILSTLGDLSPFFIVFLLAGIAASVVQHGWLFSWEPILPKWSRINPWEGMGRLFSSQSLLEAGKAIFKMTVIAMAVYLGVADSQNDMVGLAITTPNSLMSFLTSHSLAIIWRVALAFMFLALLDFGYAWFEFTKNMRMTKQEVKDEFKQTDGDPQIKGRIRQMQREMSRRRMMQEVPKADVVITNPTHYAVALKYTPGKMEAPLVIAKGVGQIALNIRKIAEENQVPLVENPPLARTLYRSVDIGKAIPGELFKAVAEVLAYVYNLKRRLRY